MSRGICLVARRITKKDRDKFQQYIIEMDDVLDKFTEEASQAGYDLDYSLKSLDTLEEYWLAVSPHVDDPERLFQRAARYYGEVFRLNFGGEWRLCDEDPQLMFYGYPVIAGFDPKNPDYEFCPLFYFEIFTVRKIRGLLRQQVDTIFPPDARPTPSGN